MYPAIHLMKLKGHRLYVGMLWLGHFIPYSLKIVTKMDLSIVFPCMIYVIMKNRRIETKRLDLFGNSSYEIYLVQGLFVQYLKLPWDCAYANEIASILNVVSSMVLGYLVSKFIRFIYCRRNSHLRHSLSYSVHEKGDRLCS